MIRYLNETYTYRIRPTSDKKFTSALTDLEAKIKLTQATKKENLIKNGEASVSEIKDIKYTPHDYMNGECALIIIEEVTYYTEKRFKEVFTY